VINEYESFGGFVGCTDRTNLHARGVFAVVTHFGHKKGAYSLFLKVSINRLEALSTAVWGVNIDAAVCGYNVPFHPCSKCVLRYVIFLGARTYTAAPADTLADIDNIGPMVFGAPLLP
jgi:hypothetical protein